MIPGASESITNPYFHGISQVMYEMTSAAANNGSGFEGLKDDTTFWNTVEIFQNVVSSFSPSNPDPLFAAADVISYITCEIYLNMPIGAREMKCIVLVFLIHPILILAFSALAFHGRQLAYLNILVFYQPSNCI
jgi:K+-transporting ATPase A subunit